MDPFSRRREFFSADDLIIFTYNNQITEMILNHELNKPEEGHLFLPCHSNLNFLIPNITYLKDAEKVEQETTKIDFLIRCKCVKQYTDYFELGVWIRTMERQLVSNRLILKEYKKIGIIIKELKIVIDEMIGRNKSRLLTWINHLLPFDETSKLWIRHESIVLVFPLTNFIWPNTL